MMNQLEENIRYHFHDTSVLQLALTHCSYGAEHSTEHNQRLEFLGDAVLEHVISDYIFHSFREYDEGKMTRLRASIVSEKPLSTAAKKIGLSEFVLLGIGEMRSGGTEKASVLSDTLEALFAAVYLDGGFEKAKEVILFVLHDVIEECQKNPFDHKDYKTLLQEKLFKNGNVEIEYRTVSVKGPSGQAVFTVEVLCNGTVLGTGQGTSKKKAAQAAAQYALQKSVH